jgi:hypothetical protein
MNRMKKYIVIIAVLSAVLQNPIGVLHIAETGPSKVKLANLESDLGSDRGGSGFDGRNFG